MARSDIGAERWYGLPLYLSTRLWCRRSETRYGGASSVSEQVDCEHPRVLVKTRITFVTRRRDMSGRPRVALSLACVASEPF